MKGMKLILLAAAAVTLVLGANAYAFHSGGVAECVGCHSMHDAQGGALLVGSDASSTCLNCHGTAPAGSSYKISTPDASMPAGTPPGNRTPGGDFGWLKKTYTWSPRTGTTETEEGDRHGHNIIAADFGYIEDATNAAAPGGTFDSSNLACSSCHDQHGKLRRLSDGTIATTGAPIIGSGSYNNSLVPLSGQAVGVYRLLRGVGSDPVSGVTYTDPAPSAVVPSSYNRSEATTDTRVAYGRGWSSYCATCHPDMHTDSGRLVHPVDQNLGSTISGNYNSYKGSGNLTGDVTTAYDSVIPFQMDNTTDFATLAAKAVNDGSVKTGAASTDRVMCLSCHRAHASGWKYMTRWNNEIEIIVVEGLWPGSDSANAEAAKAKWTLGRTTAETAKAYNDKASTNYATYQRVLCNKCHAKD